MSRINDEEPIAREIGIDELVDSIAPGRERTVVYPARHPSAREFTEEDPYGWVDKDVE